MMSGLIILLTFLPILHGFTDAFLPNQGIWDRKAIVHPVDPDMLVGMTLKMSCIMEDDKLLKKYTSDDIRFMIGDVWMPESETHVINATSAMLLHNNLEPEHNAKLVMCYVCPPCEGEECTASASTRNCSNVGSTYMHVGYPPHKAEIINPKIVNWEYLAYSWKVQPNIVYKTNHTPMFKTLEMSSWRVCPLVGAQLCRVNKEGGFDPEVVTYELQVHSQSGKGGIILSDIFTLHVPQYVEVNAVRDLRIGFIGSDHVVLLMASPKPGRTLTYEARYEDPWKQGVIPQVSESTSNVSVMLAVRGLVPFTTYTFHVQCIFKGSIYWSRNSTIQHTTQTALPGAPPVITDGAFVYTPKNQSTFEARIFWQAPAPILLNGEFRNYEITYYDPVFGRKTVKTRKTWIVIKDLRKNSKYNFIVNIANSQGMYDPSTSTLPGISIYSDRQGAPANLNLTVIAHSERDVVLRWKKQQVEGGAGERTEGEDGGERAGSVHSITVYWCQTDPRSQQCQENSSLSWKDLSPSVDSYTVVLAEGEYNMDYMFGLSLQHQHTDGGSNSTGILWSHCTYSEDEDYTKAVVSVKATDSESVSLSIKQPPCRSSHGRAYVYAYNVLLCPKEIANMCKDSPEEAIENVIYASEADFFIVDNLAEETEYTLQVTSMSAFKQHHNPHIEHIATTKAGRFRTWQVLLMVIGGIILIMFMAFGCFTIYKCVHKSFKQKVHLDIEFAPTDANQQNFENISRQQHQQPPPPQKRSIQPPPPPTISFSHHSNPLSGGELAFANIPYSIPKPRNVFDENIPMSLSVSPSRHPHRLNLDTSDSLGPGPLVVQLDPSVSDDYNYSLSEETGEDYQPTMYTSVPSPETAAEFLVDFTEDDEMNKLLGNNDSSAESSSGAAARGKQGKKMNQNHKGECSSSSADDVPLTVDLPQEYEEEEEEEVDEYLQTAVCDDHMTHKTTEKENNKPLTVQLPSDTKEEEEEEEENEYLPSHLMQSNDLSSPPSENRDDSGGSVIEEYSKLAFKVIEGEKDKNC